MSNKLMSPRKQMAMGAKTDTAPKYAKGGRIGALKSGVPMSPLTQSKRENGIPGYKKGGKC